MRNTKLFCLSILFTYLFSCTLLTGCQQTVFGVPQDQWNRLTPQQQSQVIDAYNQRKQTEAQNAPLIAAIGAASTLLKNNDADYSDNAKPALNTTATFNPPSK